tara:strand:- start:12 stop:905 length:894 start_codon:yes stop_codon:yes gene_type:complete
MDFDNHIVKTEMIGNAKVLTVDNFFKNPDKVRELAFNVPHSLGNETRGEYFPGSRAIIRLEMGELRKYYLKLLEDEYNEYDYLHHMNPRRFSTPSFQAIYSDFSNGYEAMRNIGEFSFVPHSDVSADSWGSRAFASTIWLNKSEECKGGTAFYKWKQYDTQTLLVKNNDNMYMNNPGYHDSWEEMSSLESFKDEFERWDKRYPKIGTEEHSAYLRKLNDDWFKCKGDYTNNRFFWTNLDEVINVTNGRPASDEWEILGVTPMKYNRLVFYQGMYFHGQFTESDWFSDYPRIQMQHFF